MVKKQLCEILKMDREFAAITVGILSTNTIKIHTSDNQH